MDAELSLMPSMLSRGFEEAEFVMRLKNAQALMAAQGVSGLLLMSEPEVRYFTGFLTRFWESPTRPWFLLVPQRGRPTAATRISA